jgi:hypothetical protein
MITGEDHRVLVHQFDYESQHRASETEYKSAHIDGVESELVVRSGHSTQATPQTIEEVRRILYEHAGIH